jgi:hypothetical protein
MRATTTTEEKTMAISFPAPEAAVQQRVERQTAKSRGPSLVAHVVSMVERGYRRLNSAVFDPEGDCMRL